MALKVPLASEQIAAANRIHQRLPQWSLADDALDKLKNRFPEFDPVSCLLKAAAVNALYSTHVFALTSMADHASDLLMKEVRSATGPELVERLALLGINGKVRRFHSFAAKFCHFFVDFDRFPIFDQYASEMVSLHLGAAKATDISQP